MGTLNPLDNFFEEQEEPYKSVFLVLRSTLLSFHPQMKEAWKYKIPFYMLNGKNVCYLHRKVGTELPYIGIVHKDLLHHPALQLENRKWIKSLPIPVDEDIPIETIREIISPILK